LRKLVSIHQLHSGGCGSLHFILTSSFYLVEELSKRLKSSDESEQGLNALVTGGFVFNSALVLALAYTSTQDLRGQKATFLVITIPAQWTPYAMLLMTAVMASPQAAIIQATGLVAAHLYDFLTRLWPEFGGGRNMLPTPAFVRRWFFVRQRDADYGTAIRPITGQPSAQGSGSSTGGVLPESWRNRGSGHRLGGD
jgi:Derlin-2/3